MSTVIEEVTAQVSEPPAPHPDPPEAPRRPAPDIPRIQAELRRETERVQRLWCD
jgi:hypothetical protein